MRYKFYQNLLPFKKLIEVGEYDVPDEFREWRIPLKNELRAFADISVPPSVPLNDHHIYYKSAIGFVAHVETKVQTD